MSQYIVYNIFTEAAFGGNQLAVFPDARDIAEDKLQSIAAEFNFSEVIFIYPPEDKSHTARLGNFGYAFNRSLGEASESKFYAGR